MKTFHLYNKATSWCYVFISLCLLVGALGSVQRAQAAPGGCSEIYNGSNGWVIQMCATESDPDYTAGPMQILVNGVSRGNAVLVRIYHKSQNNPGTPQIAIIYSSGFVRLKQNADPSPSIPFGTSFILGPAYWPGVNTYYHNPQLNRLEIDTSWLPNALVHNAPLRMRALGTNHDFNVMYEMTLPPPHDRQTRLHVTQTYTATANITINQTRRAERQGFKLVQASSMFINQGGTCDGGFTDCHDSNSARFIGNNLARHQTAFVNLTAPTFVFGSPMPLGSTWLDVLHTDDQSWQSGTGAGTSGNTPNVRIALDDLPITRTITPQGWITSTTNPNKDNVNLWLHDDGPASASWLAGQSGRISYWLLAQDNPPEPLADLGLRSGLTFLDFEGTHNCFFVKDISQPTGGTVSPISGYSNKALQLNYNVGSNNGNWAQLRCDFDPPLNLSAYDHLRFDWRGNPAAANSLEVGLIDTEDHIFARSYHHATQRSWWGQIVIPFSFLHPWTPGTQFDPSQVSALFISVVKDPVDDTGGAGSIAIDNLNAFNVRSRIVPVAFEMVNANQVAAQAAANWLASQQQPNGLLKSWKEETTCVAHTYDQALALIVFADRGMWAKANALAGALVGTQNTDGSWFKSRNCSNLAPVHDTKWEGDIAWAVYALRRYLDLGGTHAQATTALRKGADWLATRVNPVDGCLVIDHTEGTIDAWWAFQAAGASYVSYAQKIENCLLTYYWDETMGRFKGGRNWWQPYLDNQTWGGAFLKAIGESAKARRALSYARDVLRLPAQGGQLFGFDGQGGPWSVWNEGTAQYIAVGGEGSRDLLIELLAQQEKDGAMVGSPDEFNGGGVWTTRWHGVAPTAWLYNALSNEPFYVSPSNTDVYAGGVKQGSYSVPFHDSAKVSYPGLNNGPVRVQSINGIAIIASERVAYSPNGGTTWTSYSELIGLPANQLTNSYTFPWYNNADLNSQLRFANVGSSNTTVTVTVGGIVQGSYPLAPNASQRVSYVGLDAGPVKITSSGNVPIIASMRVAYFDGSDWTSFSEIMGLPSNKLTNSYIFPWYNNLDLNSQLRFGNVGTTNTIVTVTVGGVFKGSYSLAPNESKRVSYTGLDGGPVKVTSSGNVPIIASMRVAYHDGSAWTNFSEMMGLPGNQLGSHYSFPIYNNASLNTQIRFGNIGSTNTTITVKIGGVLKGSYNLAPNASQRVSYVGVDGGPLVIQSSGGVPIIASQRVAYFDGSDWISFAEMIGLPQSQLTTTYLFPWYNNLDLDTQLRFGVP